MGEVFVGQPVGPKAQPGDDLVAIKTLLPEVAADPAMLGRFLDEARISARLRHPNIAQLLDFGEAAGRPFAVFELLDGADLGDCLDQLIVRRAQIPVEVAVAFAMGACRGLHHAHTLEDQGQPLEVVHRDLSPSNLFLTRAGQVKVLDFGAACGRNRITRTATGMVIGKLEYMSPEQALGKKVDARTDVFGLGLCLHEALTGKRPYHSANEREMVQKIVHARVPDLASARPGLPAPLIKAVHRALAADPGHRFASTEDFAQALEAVFGALCADPAEGVLSRFYGNCFGRDRHELRARRLQKLLSRADAPDAAFAWEAPPMAPAGEDREVSLSTGHIEVVGGATQSERDAEPTTDREPEVGDDPAAPRAASAPVRPPRAASAPVRPPRAASAPVAVAARPVLGYALVAAAVLLALGLGALLGRVGALLGH